MVLAHKLGRSAGGARYLLEGRGDGSAAALQRFRQHGDLRRRLLPAGLQPVAGLLGEMAITLQIAVWGTALAVILSIPFGLMSAENIVPWWIYQPMRRLMDACRAINEMVFAMLFVVAVGLGPFAGVMALFIHTTGVLSKLLSEAVEAIEPGPVEGIRATGANKIEEILYGVLPQVMPLLISYSLYRFESNVRSATVVGMVGAGGIGVTLWEAIRGFQFQQTCALMVLIIVTVSLLDFLSQRLRKHFI
ncbi:phosphonate ABC transporter, permease protein PhnE [Enterobacter hormaechei]|uniref:phosphonate ABC transporter, permease protein PhnE n=1 Tax=Enterobacter hormaechei TaxID=158836 RepID=UPI003C768E21